MRQILDRVPILARGRSGNPSLTVAALIGLMSFSTIPPTTTARADEEWIARGKLGMVASDSPEASQIGADVLSAGGNAFDAAIATSFALGVARPHSCGLGGGGFMLAYIAKEKRFVALDFRETAPEGATPERFAKLAAERNDGPSASIFGGNAIATPGQLAGLVEICDKYASRPLSELVEPAAKLADGGFKVDENLLSAIKNTVKKAERWPTLANSSGMRLIAPGGRKRIEDEPFPRPLLAQALRIIGQQGRAAIYDGPIGEAIVAAAQKAGGTLTMDDLRAYKVIERDPIRSNYKNFEIISMPPPSSGGICIAQTLNIMEAASKREDLQDMNDRGHVMVEAMKHAFADRARHLGDPDFAHIPVAALLSSEHAARCAAQILPDATLSPEQYGRAAQQPDDDGTSHFCVADRDGNIVSITQTINGTFGSMVVAEPYGIILNNEIDDFLTVPGEANLYGLTQSEANLVGPGKRPLSSMSPTIILKDSKPFLTLGASGGPRIITSVLAVAMYAMNDRPMDKAINKLRMHHQWQPDEVYFDHEPMKLIADNLREHGHTLSNQRKYGIVQAILFLADGTMVGASDPRKGGRAAKADR
jgi:gamma-glutamyltranspeptidase/glutathione hydrolase